MHPLALAESGWVWVGAGSRPAGLRTGRAIPGLRRDAALPVRQNTRQGREGGALPKPCFKFQMRDRCYGNYPDWYPAIRKSEPAPQRG